MNAKSTRSRSRNSGVTRMPSSPQTTRSPVRTSRSLRHDGRAVGADDDHRVHALPRNRQPSAVDAHVACAGSWSSRSPRARSRRDRRRAASASCSLDGMAAERNQLLDEARSPAVGVGGHLQRELREIVVGPADLEVLHLERAAALDDGIEDGLEQLRVDQVALRLNDHSMLWCFGHEATDYSHGSRITRNGIGRTTGRGYADSAAFCGENPLIRSVKSVRSASPTAGEKSWRQGRTA